jgi:hypothetical protein
MPGMVMRRGTMATGAAADDCKHIDRIVYWQGLIGRGGVIEPVACVEFPSTRTGRSYWFLLDKAASSPLGFTVQIQRSQISLLQELQLTVFRKRFANVPNLSH